MDVEAIKQWFTIDNLMHFVREFRALGPIPGILLTFLEAFLPFLPLVLFVMVNASAFGLWLGFLYSWIGACLGAFLVFFLTRKYGQKRFLSFLPKHKKVLKLMEWIDHHGFGPIFLLLCFPFTPSALVNIVAGLSKISAAQYMLAVCIGKMVMIFTISFIGYDLHSLLTKPFRTVIVLIAISILWYVGKRVEVRLNKSNQNEHNGKIDKKEKRRSVNEG